MNAPPLKVERRHPHGAVCRDFSEALHYGHLVVIEGEPQIPGKVPPSAKMGNILTGETYDPKDFVLNMVIHYCPFCGVKVYGEPE